MKTYALENEILKIPRRMQIFSFKLETGTVITPLFNFHWELGVRCTKFNRFVLLEKVSKKFSCNHSLILVEKELKTHYQ